MPRPLFMADLVARCQRRVAMEGDDSVITPMEWRALISEQYAQLYGVVVQAGVRYFEAVATIVATGAASYPVPPDHDETIGIDRVVDMASLRTEPLGELQVQERNRWSGQTGVAAYYALAGQAVVLSPRPTSGTYLHLYVPQSPDISTLPDTSTVDVVTGDGEAFLVWGVGVKALGKTESNTDLAIREREAANARFAEDVGRRALVNPRRRIVVRSPGYDEDWLANDPADWRNR